MHNDNRLYKHLIENDILYFKQFGFQNGHSTDHAVVQSVDQNIESFENNKYTLGVFIDLLKAFVTVDYSILLKKIGTILYNGQKSWMGQNYLSNRRQFIQINEKEKNKLRDDQLWYSARLNFRATAISFI